MNPIAPESAPERLAAQRQILEALCGIGAALIVGLAVLKASVTLVAFPGWDIDPMTMAAPMVGLGPTATLAIDCSLLTLAGAMIALCSPLVGRFPAIELLLLLAGVASVSWHGLFSGSASQENLLLGMGWVAAMSAAVALAHAARIPSVRRIGAAVALGFLAFLAFKGAMQVWVDTPQTIAEYKRNREAILASHGWSPESFAARTFERRLYDSVATGWFGLSNVVATFGAAGVGAFLVLILRERGRALRVLAILGFAGALVCTWLAASKGGWAAAAIGSFVGLAGPLIVRQRRFLGAVLMLAIPICAIGAIVARGVIGEHIAELSLLFRSQYLNAAARIFAANPIAGVGPAGFKDAYLIAKSPLSPEEISSPHNVLFDFAATLGVAGIAWSVLWLALLALAGANLANPIEEPDKPDPNNNTRTSFRLAALALALATLGSAWVENLITTPSGSVARIASLGCALLIAWRVCAASETALRVALVAAAAACGFHAMIEVTAVQSGSSVLFASIVGLAAAQPAAALIPVRRGVFKIAVPGLFMACLGILSSSLVARVQNWESLLLGGAERLEPVTTLAQEIATSDNAAALSDAVSDLGRMLGRPVAPNRESINRALQDARRKAGSLAYEDLIMAIAADPSSQATRQAASNLSLQLAALEGEGAAQGGPLDSIESRRLRSALDLAEDSARLPWHRASAATWLATVRRGIWQLTLNRTMLDGAYQASVEAAELDPHNPLHAATCARLAQALGNSQAARDWAKRALTLDENMRLDPLRRFERHERQELEGLSKSSE
ncbi:MAG: O-antigen ligase family protein [Phycisphaeraceae bacterium]|nr:O-antigen ligase family protein [Phycisphaeraceae bacterium]